MRRFAAVAMLVVGLASPLAQAGGVLTVRFEAIVGVSEAASSLTIIECLPELDDYCAKLERAWRSLARSIYTSYAESGAADEATYRVVVRLPGSSLDQERNWHGSRRHVPKEFRDWMEVIEESASLDAYSTPAPECLQ